MSGGNTWNTPKPKLEALVEAPFWETICQNERIPQVGVNRNQP